MIAQVDLRYLYANTLQEMAMFPNPFDCNICKCLENNLIYTFNETANYQIPTGNTNIVPHLAEDGTTILTGQWIRLNLDADIGYSGLFSRDGSWGVQSNGYYTYQVSLPTRISDHICQIYRKTAENVYEVAAVDSQVQNNNTLLLKIPAIPDCRFTGKYVLLPVNYINSINSL